MKRCTSHFKGKTSASNGENYETSWRIHFDRTAGCHRDNRDFGGFAFSGVQFGTRKCASRQLHLEPAPNRDRRADLSDGRKRVSDESGGFASRFKLLSVGFGIGQSGGSCSASSADLDQCATSQPAVRFRQFDVSELKRDRLFEKHGRPALSRRLVIERATAFVVWRFVDRHSFAFDADSRCRRSQPSRVELLGLS